MLTDITTKERYERVSSLVYAYGYIGSVIPFVLSIVLILFKDKLQISLTQAMIAAFMITASWWLLSTLPLLKSYQQNTIFQGKHRLFRQPFSV